MILREKSFRGGFTLLEVLISVVIIGVLAGVSAPVFQSLQLKSDLDLAMNVIVGSLRRAQVLSQAVSGNSTWGVGVSQGSVTLFQGPDFLSRDPSFDEVFEMSNSIVPSGLSEVVFSRLLGSPGSFGDIVLTALTGETRTVTINSKGSISFDLIPPLGDWASPVLGPIIDIAGTNDGWKVWAEGNYAYMVRLGGAPNFVIVNIVDVTNPTIIGSLNLPGTPENIHVFGNHAYVASRSNAQELQVIDISNPLTPSVVGTYNAPGTANGRGVYVDSGVAYLVRTSSGDDEFIAIDVSTPSSPAFLGSLGLADTAREVVVLGSYVYLASHSNSQEFQVVDVSVVASPSLVASINLGGNANGLTIAGFGGTVVLGRLNGQIQLVNVSAPLTPSLLGVIDTGGAINDISLGNSNKYVFIASNTNSAEFQVIDISALLSPALLGSLNLPVDLNGVSYHSGADRAFVVGDDDIAEFMIIEPQ